jgi:zinc/manganese transport system permease protein
VQLVGVYLVFASLIIPALSARRAGKYALIIAFLLGITSYAAGLFLSALLDLPAGAVIVWVLAFIGLFVSLLIARRSSHLKDGTRNVSSTALDEEDEK